MRSINKQLKEKTLELSELKKIIKTEQTKLNNFYSKNGFKGRKNYGMINNSNNTTIYSMNSILKKEYIEIKKELKRLQILFIIKASNFRHLNLAYILNKKKINIDLLSDDEIIEEIVGLKIEQRGKEYSSPKISYIKKYKEILEDD